MRKQIKTVVNVTSKAMSASYLHCFHSYLVICVDITACSFCFVKKCRKSVGTQTFVINIDESEYASTTNVGCVVKISISLNSKFKVDTLENNLTMGDRQLR